MNVKVIKSMNLGIEMYHLIVHGLRVYSCYSRAGINSKIMEIINKGVEL